MGKSFKILVSAYACNPRKGSEPGVGWGWVKAIAQRHEVWVLTDRIQKIDIEKKISEAPDRYENLHFHYVPRTRWRAVEKIWPPSYLWTYQMWQKDAYELAVKLHKEIGFDLAHQLTYVGFRNPGYLWRLNIPFIWGPIGGLENTPWRFLPMLGLNGFVYYAARNIINSLHKRFLKLPKLAFQKAEGGIIAATEGIRKEIQKWYGFDSEVICEIGPPDAIASDHSVRKTEEPFRLSWSGLHEPAKALPLLLRAVALLPKDVNWQLAILGKGSCTGKWQKEALKLGVNDRCIWHGWLPRREALSVVHKSHAFLITSLKDLTSSVLLEALSQGVPVICPDHCGFSSVVTNACGIKVPLKSPRQFEADMVDAIKSLAEDEQKRRHLADGAFRRSRDFMWEKKAQDIDSIYEGVVESNQ